MMQPWGDRLLIKLEEQPEMSAGGIILPDQARQKPVRGDVAAVGAEADNLFEGRKIIFSQYAGIVVEDDDDTEYLIIRESDVLALL